MVTRAARLGGLPLVVDWLRRYPFLLVGFSIVLPRHVFERADGLRVVNKAR